MFLLYVAAANYPLPIRGIPVIWFTRCRYFSTSSKQQWSSSSDHSLERGRRVHTKLVDCDVLQRTLLTQRNVLEQNSRSPGTSRFHSSTHSLSRLSQSGKHSTKTPYSSSVHRFQQNIAPDGDDRGSCVQSFSASGDMVALRRSLQRTQQLKPQSLPSLGDILTARSST